MTPIFNLGLRHFAKEMLLLPTVGLLANVFNINHFHMDALGHAPRRVDGTARR